jgi:hypothetical protein
MLCQGDQHQRADRCPAQHGGGRIVVVLSPPINPNDGVQEAWSFRSLPDDLRAHSSRSGTCPTRLQEDHADNPSTPHRSGAKAPGGCSIASVCAIMPLSEAPPGTRRRTRACRAGRLCRPPCRRACTGGEEAANRPSAHRRHDVERAPAVDLARQADVAVVEPDHMVAARRERGAELVVPENHLRGQPHDEEQRARAGGAEDLVLELDAVGARARHDQRPRVSRAIRSRTAVGIT